MCCVTVQQSVHAMRTADGVGFSHAYSGPLTNSGHTQNSLFVLIIFLENPQNNKNVGGQLESAVRTYAQKKCVYHTLCAFLRFRHAKCGHIQIGF